MDAPQIESYREGNGNARYGPAEFQRPWSVVS
jgi:hypothetical protein